MTHESSVSKFGDPRYFFQHFNQTEITLRSLINFFLYLITRLLGLLLIYLKHFNLLILSFGRRLNYLHNI